MSKSKNKAVIVLSCLLAAVACAIMAEDQPAAPGVVPDIGSRTSDGFQVTCYLVGNYRAFKKGEGQGVIDLFGQSLSPLCYKQVTTASVIFTEERGSRGEVRFVFRAGSWRSDLSGLHYWLRPNKRLAAGGNVSSGEQRFPLSGAGTPTAGVWHDVVRKNTIEVSVGVPLRGFKFRCPGLKERGRPHLDVVLGEVKDQSAEVSFMTMNAEAESGYDPTEFRAEQGSEGSGSYARWIVTRVCSTGKLKLVTPRGDPRTAPRAPDGWPWQIPPPEPVDGQNEFTFDRLGRLFIHFKASITPASAINSVRDRVSFSIDPIGNSVLEWGPRNTNGKAMVENDYFVASATFTGLPKKNDDFGLKTVKLLLDGQVSAQTKVEIFFSKGPEKEPIANHPGGPGMPNWFYYWREGGVCGIDADTSYDPKTKYWGYCEYRAAGPKIILGREAAALNPGPVRYTGSLGYGSVTTTGSGKGIKCAAETMEHERHHGWIYLQYDARIVAGLDRDPDGDGIPSQHEATLDGIRTDPNDPNTFHVPDYPDDGDNDIRCQKKELSPGIRYFPKKDWANPGCQSRVRYGPN